MSYLSLIIKTSGYKIVLSSCFHHQQTCFSKDLSKMQNDPLFTCSVGVHETQMFLSREKLSFALKWNFARSHGTHTILAFLFSQLKDCILVWLFKDFTEKFLQVFLVFVNQWNTLIASSQYYRFYYLPDSQLFGSWFHRVYQG